MKPTLQMLEIGSMERSEMIQMYDAMKRQHEIKATESVRQSFIDSCLSAIPERYRNLKLSNLKTNNVNYRNAINILQRYLHTFEDRLSNGTSMILTGGVGAGKTSTICALLHELIVVGYDCHYTTCSKLIKDIKKWAWKDYEYVMSFYKKPDFLVIDEAPSDDFDSKERQYFFDVIDARYLKRKCTAIITNLDHQELKDVLGLRIIDRLQQNYVTIGFNWSSLRTIHKQ